MTFVKKIEFEVSRLLYRLLLLELESLEYPTIYP